MNKEDVKTLLFDVVTVVFVGAVCMWAVLWVFEGLWR